MTAGRLPIRIADVFAGAEPTAEALVTRSGRFTYDELDRLCDRAAWAWSALGVRSGDRVGVSLPNDSDVVAAFHGLMRIGAVWVGVNRNLAEPEKAYLREDSGTSRYLDDDALDEWRDALGSASPVELPSVDPDAPAGIAYTSGTTGRPKGAVHTQRGLLAPGTAMVASRGYDASLRKGDCFPLTILNMQILTTLLVAQAGGCSVIMDRIDAGGVVEWIRGERVTTWNGPPALLHSMITDDAITADDLSSLDEVLTGGADCPESLRERFAAKFGRPVLATYGLSEAPSVITIDGRDGAHRPGASGRALPHVAVRIIGDDGRELPVGEAGEICVGPVDTGEWAGAYRLMLGYLDRPDATASTLTGGLLHTGDIGQLDDDGFLYVRDRKNLVIIRGGANVYPAEVERVLADAPGVGASAVLGVADDRLGERVVAVLQPAPGATIDVAEVTTHLLVHLARYKVPERFVVVDELPRNAMGKVQRPSLAALFESPATLVDQG